MELGKFSDYKKYSTFISYLSSLETRAYMFATIAHGDQKRKYTNEPYINHCIEVARLCKFSGMSERYVSAAFLHDVIEDTNVTIDFLRNHFDESIVKIVDGLTDISKPENGNRAKRKEIDRLHILQSSDRSMQLVKCADIISNSRDICVHDLNFATVYMNEIDQLLNGMRESLSGEFLYDLAMDMTDSYFATKKHYKSISMTC